LPGWNFSTPLQFSQSGVFCSTQKITMTKLYLAAFIFVSTLASCGGNDKEDVVDKELMKAAAESKAAQKPDTVLSTMPATITQPATPVVTGSVPVTQPVTLGKNVMPVATAVPATTNTQQPTAAGMNPPHGQPNHRCDIPVGAPLNSKPQTATNPAATISTTPSPATAQATAPGMNPPHGQPNHRCDIAVGAPLNSKPPQATISTTTTAAPKADSVKN